MTSSSENLAKARLHLESQPTNTLVSVFDTTLRLIQSAEGSLDIQLAPGVYRIQGRVGDSENTQLIMLAPGANETRDLSVEFTGGARARGTRIMNESHATLAHRLSFNVAHGANEESGAVLILRASGDSHASSLDTDGLRLLDMDLREVHRQSTAWHTDTYDTAIGWGERLPPGPYVLRTDRSTYKGPSEPADPDVTDQTIWLCPGWQTLVFVPNTRCGPDPREASVHMVPLIEPWEPEDPTALAVEAALASLRDGIPPSRHSVLELNHEDKVNPMLAIITLHREPQHVLQRSSWVAYEEVIAKLERRLRTAHPDLLAASTRLPHRRRELPQVRWPPMLTTSYRRCLLPADAEDDRVLLAGSPAERVAAFLRPSQPWLQWSTTKELLAGKYDRSERKQWRSREAERRAPEAAVNRVQRAVTEISRFRRMHPQRVIEQLGPRELARRCELPATLVSQVLHDPRLQRVLDPPLS